MTYQLSNRSLSNLYGIHPKLQDMVHRAIELTEIDFTVLEGLRSIERQRELVRSGASTTMNSRHLTGHAVDIAPYVNGEISWHWPHYHRLAPYIWQAADDVGLIVDEEHNNGSIQWGGLWSSFPDGPHWQLSWKHYPKGR